VYSLEGTRAVLEALKLISLPKELLRKRLISMLPGSMLDSSMLSVRPPPELHNSSALS
jgi:hypothetical protein